MLYVPPVIFTSGGNPNAGAQRRLPTAPFKPPRSLNLTIPFKSFDIVSTPASTSFSTPHFGAISGGIGSGSANFDDDSPLLDELEKDQPLLFPGGSWKHWVIDVQVPEWRDMSRPQLVDYYTEMLTKVLGNEKDAQMCIYDVSLQPPSYGFCCQLDEESARELAGVPGVISVNLDYTEGISGGSQPIKTNIIKTKKLFVTGLSFYTSEKTLREAFEGFGELVEVKIIMDKISKRSKGYAFIEYTTEEAAAAALRDMNGKIINGWMIVVDVAKTKPPKYSRRPAASY